MTTTKRTFGQWAKDNADDIMFYGTVLALGAGTAAIIIFAAISSQKEYDKEQASIEADRQAMRDAVGRGASVLPGPDGGYWIIENQK